MGNHVLELRVVYTDLPDMIELGVRVHHGEWSAVSTAYASPSFLREDAASILRWSQTLGEPVRVEAGADTGIGWLVLEFYTIDHAGHARCAITLATNGRSCNARPTEIWRFAIELPTELRLVERFAQECLTMGKTFTGEARLVGLAG